MIPTLQLAQLGRAGRQATPAGVNYTALMLHGNGTNGSPSIVDSSPFGHTVTAHGNAQITTGTKKYGSGAIAFDGTNSYLTVPDHASLTPGALDGTFEWWMNFASKTGFQTLMSKGYAVAGGLLVQTGNGDGKINVYQGAGTTLVAAEGAGTINASQWYHIAVEIFGGTLTIYRDGVSVGSGPCSVNFNATSQLAFGGGSSSGFNNFWFNGEFDDIRISRGIARYQGAFTPPAGELANSG
jgi:hypothetical protein